MAQHKGAPKAGGRQKGTPNKATADVKAVAQTYTIEAVETLARIMRTSESDAAKVAAANSILDRGHGKAKQSVEVGGTINATIKSIRLVGPEG